MELLSFYCLILKSMDKDLSKKLTEVEKKVSNIPFKNDKIYEQISEENYLFLKDELPEDKWFESINAINGLWLIYFWQDFYYSHFQKTADISALATSEDLLVIWKAFLTKYPSEGKHIWPSELILQDK